MFHVHDLLDRLDDPIHDCHIIQYSDENDSWHGLTHRTSIVVWILQYVDLIQGLWREPCSVVEVSDSVDVVMPFR